MTSKIPSRQLSPYEINHLVRFGQNNFQTLKDQAENSTIPVEYLTGKVEFSGRVFEVTPDVLIPRVETEELVTLALQECERLWKEKKEPLIIADVGAGSGAIGLTLAAELNAKKIPFELSLIDLSLKALEICRRNAENLKISNQITFIESDLLTQLPAQQHFDLIVANLPYIPSARIPTLDASVKNHEPVLALDGGLDGTKIIKKLITQLPEKLKSNGVAILEIDETHTKKVLGLDEEQKSLQTTVINDAFNKPRFVLIRFNPQSRAV